MKKHLVRIALGLLVVLLFLGHAAGHYDIPIVRKLELTVYDARLRLTMPRTGDPRIVIADIDKKGLAAEGRWPWRRDRLGLFLDRLFNEYKARVVAFDVVFAERDKSSGLQVLRELSEQELHGVPAFQAALKSLQPRLEFDRIFAEKMQGRPVVLGYFTQDPEAVACRVGQLPEPVLPKGVFQDRNIEVTRWAGYGANLPELQQAAAGAGHFNPWTDEDGVNRRVPMLLEYAGAYYEPLSLAVLRLLWDTPPIKPGFTNAPAWSRTYPGLEWLDVGQVRVPVDREVTALVPYRAPERSFKYIPAADILQGRASRSDLEGKIVLVGATAPGLLDLRSTPA